MMNEQVKIYLEYNRRELREKLKDLNKKTYWRRSSIVNRLLKM